jgi:hypothetical protein
MKLRSAVLAGWEIWQWPLKLERGPIRRVSNLGTLIRFGLAGGRMSRKVTPVKVDELVEAWVVAVVGMCTCHDKDTYDAHDAKADELMGPILTAPVKQVREFYGKLRKRLREDPKIPMVVWMGFEAWGECVVNHAEDDKSIIRLKNKLAGEIAELVELDIRDQIPEAVKRALRWRDPETLKAVKEVLESGAKPKLVGRQSCLFLEAGKGDKKVMVML